MIEKEKSLAYLYPELAKEWHPTKNGDLTPYDVTHGSMKKVWWLGKCGHEWEASPNGRIHSGRAIRGCPYCSGNKVLVGFNDLASTYPMLSKEWHPSKNNGLRPQDVSSGSGQKVWWFDSLGHEWEASISSRALLGRGCPFCARKKLLPGFNDLATTHPELAKEWHPTKNGLLKPQDVISGTHRKVWWMCSQKHEWEATCNSRADSNKGCPVCAKILGAQKKITLQIKKQGSLVDVNPELVKEWHPTKNGTRKPSEFLAGSAEKIWWIGKCGHEWQAGIKERNRGVGCPICANLQLLKGYNDLQSCYPLLAEEWHPTMNGELTPADVVFGSDKNVWWKCKVCGNIWRARVVARKNGIGCPQCSSERSTSYPEQAVFFYLKKKFPNAISRYKLDNHELDIYLPDLNLGIEYDGAFYHTESTKSKEISKDKYFLKQGIDVVHIRESRDSSRKSSNEIVYIPTSNYKSLDAAIEQTFLLIQKRYNIKSSVVIDNRKDMSEIMASYLSGIKDNSIAAACPNLLQEWDFNKNGGLNPLYLSANSNKRVWWKCVSGHEWQAVVYTRKNGSKCPYCTNKRAWPGFNDLVTVNPNLVKEWDFEKNIDIQPSMVTGHSSKKVWWKCSVCNNEWQATICNRSNGAGCPACAREKRKKNK